MTCSSCNECRTLEALESIAKDIHRIADSLTWIPAPVTVGTTKLLREENMARLVYEQTFGPLPAAEGKNADIAYGEFAVLEDDVEVSRDRVDYDLDTRQPIGPLEWGATKGTHAKLQLEYIDDDGNHGDHVEFDFGVVSDTIPPDAPESIGTTSLIREEP